MKAHSRTTPVREVRFHMNLSAGERRMLNALAKMNGLNASSFLRVQILEMFLRSFRCETCKAKPDDREQLRILRDDWKRAVAWRCPACAPDLQLTKSGLCFDVVEVGGSSPEHEYE